MPVSCRTLVVVQLLLYKFAPAPFLSVVRQNQQRQRQQRRQNIQERRPENSDCTDKKCENPKQRRRKFKQTSESARLSSKEVAFLLLAFLYSFMLSVNQFSLTGRNINSTAANSLVVLDHELESEEEGKAKKMLNK